MRSLVSLHDKRSTLDVEFPRALNLPTTKLYVLAS
jgi:hypothetical protein